MRKKNGAKEGDEGVKEPSSDLTEKSVHWKHSYQNMGERLQRGPERGRTSGPRSKDKSSEQVHN